jgi:salicylate hydroxylase
MALLDAQALGSAMATASSVADALVAYRRRRQGYVRLYQAMSRVFTPAFQSDSRALPWLRDRLVAPLDRVPIGRRLAARIVAGQFWLTPER